MKSSAVLFALLLALSLSAQSAPVAGNTAIVPVGKLENDFYDWNKRHAEILALKATLKPEIVFIGDSITHLWGGQPNEPKGNRGAAAWKDLLRDRPALNLGFGWDRTQNVLFRIQDGELDGVDPKWIVLHIGTNNLTAKNAPANTPAQIAEAIGLIIDKAHQKCPRAKVILMGVFPRGASPQDPKRASIAAINKLISENARKPFVTYLDITDKFLEPDGSLSNTIMGDYTHPTDKGYAIWAAALKPYLK